LQCLSEDLFALAPEHPLNVPLIAAAWRATEPEKALEVGEQHLDALPPVPSALEARVSAIEPRRIRSMVGVTIIFRARPDNALTHRRPGQCRLNPRFPHHVEETMVLATVVWPATDGRASFPSA
jgi:hypothetical protein